MDKLCWQRPDRALTWPFLYRKDQRTTLHTQQPRAPLPEIQGLRAGWMTGWTLSYLIWWIAWEPFMGIFVARISRGRTIREFCFGVIIVPTLFSMLWFAVFGGAGIYIERFGGGGLANVVFEDVSKALFLFFDYFPGRRRRAIPPRQDCQKFPWCWPARLCLDDVSSRRPHLR